MSTLPQSELRDLIAKGQLIRNPRLVKGRVDLQPASYDLSAGRAVWSEPKDGRSHGRARKEVAYTVGPPEIPQPYVLIQPGQMMAVITREDVVLPATLCATVYSKNSLAMNGIFAFNAGHVDPGYDGPIVIRLINLRETPYTLTLGTPIFTIVFHRLDVDPDAKDLPRRPPISQEQMLGKVRQFADIALSNALFDLYAERINERLSDHRTDISMKLRTELGEEFLRKDKLGAAFWKWGWGRILAVLAFVALGLTILRNLGWLLGWGG